MTEAGWSNIANTVMGGFVTIVLAWITRKTQEMAREVKDVKNTTIGMTEQVASIVEKTDAAAVKADDITGQVAAISEKTDAITKNTDETKEQVFENVKRLDGRLTQLLEHTRRNAYLEGHAKGMEESRTIAKELLSTEAAQGKTETEEPVTEEK